MNRFISCLFLFMALSLAMGLEPSVTLAEKCEAVVRDLNETLDPKIDEKELVSILRTLNETGNKILPPKFVTKNRARKLGWKPGTDLWIYERLKGKSIGGDVFGNREGQLPNGKRAWHEADLDYRGGKRGPKRIVYSNDGLRMLTIDHYRTFKEVPPCQ